MFELYTAPTFNGQRASIMLEEAGLDYRAHKIDLMKLEQRRPDFLKLNPSGRIPVLVDQRDGTDTPFVLTQSVAIVLYLAEKTGCLVPESLEERARVYEWLQFHAVDIGSNLFSAFFLERLSRPSHPQAAECLHERVHDLYAYFDQRLAESEYLAGDSYTVADVITLPAALAQREKLAGYPHLTRWLTALAERPAVRLGMAVPV